MEYMRLGKTEMQVSRISLGAWQFGTKDLGSLSEDEAIDIMRRAIDLGVNLIDTALWYGMGASETIVGKAVQGRRDKVIVASKCMPDPRKIVLEIDRALQRLGVEFIDLYHVHYPDSRIPIAETMGAMAQIQQAGKIRAIGVSNFWGGQLRAALATVRFDSLQPPYNVLWREVEDDALPFCREHNIAVLPYSPIAQGLLTGKYRQESDLPKDFRKKNQLFKPEVFREVLEVVERMEPIAERHGKTLGQVAINWLLCQPGVTSVIVGCRSRQQLEENAGSAGWQLSADEVAQIGRWGQAVSRMVDYGWNMWQNMPKATG